MRRLGPIAALLPTLVLVAAACSPGDEPAASSSSSDPQVSTTLAPLDIEGIDDLPPEARASTGGGDPRSPAYWAVWNSCAPDNRAEQAAANGGRDAGWFLMDDFITDPGIQLGEHLVATCEEGLAYLEGLTADGEETDDPVYDLAGRLLAAELNLSAGAETCPIADEAVLGSHLILSSSGFDGRSSSPFDAEARGALPRLLALLDAYNSGNLCG